MAYNYVTVSGTFPTLTGTVTFTPPQQVTDVTGTTHVLGPGAFACTVSGGSFTSAPLLATDNIGLLPAGWDYTTTVALTGQKAYSYPVLIPAANGTTATLSSLPVSPSGGGNTEGFNNPMTTLGDMITGGASGVATRVGGSAAAAKRFLTQTGTGSASAAPAWGTITSADLPGATTSAQGALQLDGNAADIAAPAIGASAGSGTLAAISTHVHPLNDPLQFGVAINFFPGVAPTPGAVAANNGACYSRLTSGGYAFSSLVVTVVASSGNVCVGAYTNSGSGLNVAPTGGRLGTSGSVACPSIGIATVSTGSTVTPNLGDWLGLGADNTNATFQRQLSGASAGYVNVPGWGLAQSSGGFPLPSTPSGLGVNAAVGNFIMRGA